MPIQISRGMWDFYGNECKYILRRFDFRWFVNSKWAQTSTRFYSIKKKGSGFTFFAQGLFFFIILFPISILPHAVSSDFPFDNSCNWGGTGLMEIPNARIIDDGVMRFGFSQAIPYRWYRGSIGIFPGIEISGRITELTNIDSGLGSDYGNYKDKAFDIKYQILPESKYLPALAVGINDFHGTRLFPSQYITLSRQIYPLDITLGFGTKRLKGPVTLPLTKKVGVFGGIELEIIKGISLMAEYNPIEYENDKISAVPEGSKSPVNAGLRITALPEITIDLSFQRGTTLGLSFNLEFELGKPIVMKKADPRLWYPVDRRMFKDRNGQKLVDTIRKAITEAGFNSVSVYSKDKDLIAEFENNKYPSNQKAVGRALRILLFHSPEDTKMLKVILTRRQTPFLRVCVNPDYFEGYILEKLPEEDFFEHVKVETLLPEKNKDIPQFISAKDEAFDYSIGIKPDIESYLNDPSGFAKIRVGVKPYISSTIWNGGTFAARFDLPFYSNITSSNPDLPDPVRSDSWKYSGENYTFEYLLIDQLLKLTDKTFGKFSAGYFERMYAGVGAEVLTFLGEGNFAIGMEADFVKKRKPDSFLELEGSYKHTILGNLYYKCLPFDLIFQLQYGRFLAGDTGWKMVATREYDTGAEIGFWYTITNTDNFSDEYNKNYNDKGIYLSIPLNMFTTYETRTKYEYALSPWTRDVAAQPFHWQNLFNIASDLMPGSFKAGLKKIKQ